MSIIVKCPVLPPCAVNRHYRNPLLYYSSDCLTITLPSFFLVPFHLLLVSIQPDSPDSSHGLKLSGAHRVQLIRAQSLCLQQQKGSPDTDRLVPPSSTHTVLADKTLPAKTQMWVWSCIHMHTQTCVDAGVF